MDRKESMLRNNPMRNPDCVKKRSETIIKNKLFAGVGNPRWVGGTRCYRGYKWDESKKERRMIDNYTCVKCGKKEVIGERSFDVHHLIEFKNGGTNDINNLITVCRSCHNKLRYVKN